LISLDPLTPVDQMKYRRRRRWQLRTEGGSANRIEHQPVVVSTRFRYRYQAHHTQ